MSESWRAVPGFPGYDVSDLGRVRSTRGGGDVKLLRGTINRNGYVYVSLRRDGMTVRRALHSVVLEAFLGPCPGGMEVRHYPDSSRSNNALANLAYGTRSQNACDRHEQGTMTLAKLTREQVELIKSTPPQTRGLAAKLGVSRHTVRLARLGRTWKHVAAGDSQ